MALLLLDTCALVWWMADAPELSPRAKRAIANRRNAVLVSTASLWEISIKTRRGRLRGTEEYLARHAELHAEWGFATTAIDAQDAVAAGLLGVRHDDPFDRMLIVQAERLGASIVTCDEAIVQHGGAYLW